MAMIQRNFELALEKGDIGEKIVIDYMHKHGWAVYVPAIEGSHPYDMAFLKTNEMMLGDVKTKARMNKENATGINNKHYLEYKQISEFHKIEFWLFFVDEYEKRVYGNTISKLKIPYEVGIVMYPRVQIFQNVPIVLFSLDSMIHVSNLTDEQCEELKSKSQRNHGYGIKGE